MLVVVVNIGSTGSFEPSLLASAMSTTFSREYANTLKSPCHACRDIEYRKLWLV